MRLQPILLAAALAGCEGKIVANGLDLITPPPDDPIVITDPPDVACDVARYPDMRLETIAADFTRDVYPALNRASDGCVACHAPNMGRMFKVTASGEDTFYQAHMGGFFDDKPG